ncbi:MAG: rhodanese-like domain-containing protein [Phycisphaerales bacterium]|nr:rhodanese-like domain-containing protein [Phycisphaerales bacterium]
MATVSLTENSTMREVLEAYPSAQRALMRKYHIGGCSSCGFAPEEQLGVVLARHNVSDVGDVLSHIADAHEQEQNIRISPKALAEALKSAAPPRLIDVREPFEQDICKLEGARSADEKLVQEIFSSWPKDTLIVTYCHHGMRSMEAASYLIGHGYTNVRSLDGGIDAWAEQMDSKMERY